MSKKTIAVIDPAIRIAELDCVRKIGERSKLPITHHLPSLRGDSYPPLDSLAAIIVLGSSSSVHDKLPWQKPLATFLESAFAKSIPTLGICYGHQAIAHLFGAEVKFLNEKRLGFYDVKLNGIAWQEKSSKNLFSSHREVVTTVPAEFKVWARSREVAIEGLVHSTLPIWTMQPHPEATEEFLKNCGYAKVGRTFGDGMAVMKGFLDFIAAKEPDTRHRG